MFCAPSAASHPSFPFLDQQVHYPLPLRLLSTSSGQDGKQRRYPSPSSVLPPPSRPPPPPPPPRQCLREGREGRSEGRATAAALHRTCLAKEATHRKKIQDLEVSRISSYPFFVPSLILEAQSFSLPTPPSLPSGRPRTGATSDAKLAAHTQKGDGQAPPAVGEGDGGRTVRRKGGKEGRREGWEDSLASLRCRREEEEGETADTL